MDIKQKLDLSFLAGVLKRYFPAVLLSGILCGLECVILLCFAVQDQYESRAVICMEGRNQSADSSQYFANVCQVVIESTSIQDSLTASLDLPYTKEKLSKMVFAEVADKENEVELIVRCGNPREAQSIANKLLDLSVEEFNSTMTFGTARAVSYGDLNSKPLPKGNIPLFTIIAVLAGFIASYIISAVHSLLDPVIRSHDDISQLYGFSVIAAISESDRLKNEIRRYMPPVHGSKDSQENNVSGHILSGNCPEIIARAYDSAREAITSALPQGARKIIAVTSHGDSEGKSTVSSNLAICFANAGSKVLLIDCNMIDPTISKKFGLAPNFGLSSILSGLCTVSEAVNENVVKNLDIIAAGKIPPNTAGLLGSASMKTFLEASAESYNYVFLDTPSVNTSGDSQLMNDVIAGFVFVIRENSTTHTDIKSAMDKIKHENGNILGLVKTFSRV